MTTMKPRDSTASGELNLLPIMNLICLLIPFLLMSAQFIKIGIILVETPRLSRVQSTQQEKQKEALNLSLVMTDKGYYIKSRHGSECPEGVADSDRLCFPKQDGKYTDAVLLKLQHHLWYLFANKYKDPESYATPEEKYTITVIPEPTVKYEDLVRTLDILREIPTGAKNPAPKVPVPASGCTLKFMKGANAWGFEEKGGVSTREAACMYYRVTLALGSA